MLKRNRFIGGIAILATFLLLAAACSSGNGGTAKSSGSQAAAFPSSPPASEDKGPLKVLMFAGDDDPNLNSVFTQNYPNAKVEYVFGDSNEDFFSKVQTGSVDADVVYGACVNFLPNWQQAGLIAPLDTSRLTNWADLNSDVEKIGAIDGQQMEAVTYYGYDSIVAATGTGPVAQSWADLWDPQYKNQFSMIDYAENGVQMTAVALGLPYPDLSDQQLDQIKQKLMDLRPNIRSYWSTISDPIQQLSNGEVRMFYGWPSQYATLVQDKVASEYVNESEGRLSWSCGSIVMANTQHYNLALAWVDGRLSAQDSAALIDTQYVGVANTKAPAMATNQEVVKGLGYDDFTVFAASHPAAALTDEQRQKFNQLWSEVKAG